MQGGNIVRSADFDFCAFRWPCNRFASVQGSFQDNNSILHEPQFAKHRRMRLLGETEMFGLFHGVV